MGELPLYLQMRFTLRPRARRLAVRMTCTHQHGPRSPLACGMICLSSRESPPHPSVFPRPWANSESQTNDTMPPENLATICVPPKSGSTAYFAIFGGNPVETIGFKVSDPYPT